MFEAAAEKAAAAAVALPAAATIAAAPASRCGRRFSCRLYKRRRLRRCKRCSLRQPAQGGAARSGPCASQRREGPGAAPAPASPGRSGRERPGLIQNCHSGVIWAGKYTGNRAQVSPELQFWDLMQIYIFEYKFA